MTNTKKTIIIPLVLLYAAYTMGAFFKISANIVMPYYQKQFSMSGSAVGIISGLYFASYSVFQLLSGPLCSKYGPLKVVGTGFIVSFLGALCFAYAKSPLTIGLGRFFVGIGAGTTFVSVISFLTENFTGKKYALFSGISVTFSGLGQLLGSNPLQFLLSEFGIKKVFSTLAFLMLMVSITMLILSEKKNSAEETKQSGIFSQIVYIFKIVFSKPLLLSLTILWLLFNSYQNTYQGLWSSAWCLCTFPDKSAFSGTSALLVSLGLMLGTSFSELIIRKNTTRTKSTINSEILFLLSAFAVPFVHNLSFHMILIFDLLLGFFIGHICIQMTAYTRENVDKSINATVMGFMNFTACVGTVFFQWITGLSVDLMGGNSNANFTKTFLVFCLIIAVSTFITIHYQKKALINHQK